MANEVAVVEFINRNKTKILERLPKLNEWLTPEIWISFLIDLAKRRELQEAYEQNPDSLLKAFMTLADWGLKPDGEEAFINVRRIDGKQTALAQWMYKGGIRRAVEVKAIAHAVADLIREGDKVTTHVDRHGRHIQVEEHHAANSKVVGAYCLFWLPNGLMDYEKLDLADIERCKEASMRNMNGKTSPAWQYSYGEMAKVKAYRRGLKRMQGKRELKSMLDTPDYDAETTGTPVDPGELADHEIPRARVDGGKGGSEEGEADGQQDVGGTEGSAHVAAAQDAITDEQREEAKKLWAASTKKRNIMKCLNDVRGVLGPEFTSMDDLKTQAQYEAFVEALVGA